MYLIISLLCFRGEFASGANYNRLIKEKFKWIKKIRNRDCKMGLHETTVTIHVEINADDAALFTEVAKLKKQDLSKYVGVKLREYLHWIKDDITSAI